MKKVLLVLTLLYSLANAQVMKCGSSDGTKLMVDVAPKGILIVGTGYTLNKIVGDRHITVYGSDVSILIVEGEVIVYVTPFIKTMFDCKHVI